MSKFVDHVSSMFVFVGTLSVCKRSLCQAVMFKTYTIELLPAVLTVQVEWPICGSIEQLEEQVDKSRGAVTMLKHLASATLALCSQVESNKKALEKHLKEEKANREKEEQRLKGLQKKCGSY